MSIGRRIIVLLSLALLGSAIAAGPAAADYIAHVGSFTGAGSTTGPFVKPVGVAVNQATGEVLVLDEGKASPVSQYDSSGNAKPFSALGASNTLGPMAVGPFEYWVRSTSIAVDNSGTATQGRIYVGSVTPQAVYAFNPDGTPVGGKWPITDVEASCGVVPDKDGDIWIVNGNSGFANEYSADGTPKGKPREAYAGCRSEFNEKDFLFTCMYHFGQSRVYDDKGVSNYGYDFAAPECRDLSVDPDTLDVYVVSQGARVVRFDELSHVIETFGEEDPERSFTGLVDAEGAAYGATKKSIYVSDIGSKPAKVNVFAYVPPKPPVVDLERVKEVRSAGAKIEGRVAPEGGETTYAVEYGPTTAYGTTIDGLTTIPNGFQSEFVNVALAGLTPGTQYHYRLVATNKTTSTPSPDHTFTTYALPEGGEEECENALARQQTGAASLLDCRAYEMVSAAYTAGYDVESDQVPNAAPLSGYPGATDPPRVAYTTRSGSIPGTDNPTGHVGDPYVATRTDDGWSTEYVGIPANSIPGEDAFSSPMAAADAGLGTIAFGGSNLCAVCLPDGSAGIPIRMPDGQLVQGMEGSIDVADPTADGYVAKHFSADGSHFLFGSADKFEADGNSNGDVSIYDRNLNTGVTKVISKTAAGSNLPCLGGAGTCHSPGDAHGIAALDISADGSHVIVAQRVATDTNGNDYWHLYLSVGASGQTVDLTPGTTSGVLYDGMSADGSEVFFSTADDMAGSDDADTSSDIYRATVDGASVDLTRISSGVGGTGNTDSCAPVGDFHHSRWNSIDNADTCDALAIAGGGGLGIGDGTVYFLSPELLDGAGNGIAGAPNLFVAERGESPRFVATLESSLNPPSDPDQRRPYIESFGTFQQLQSVYIDPDNGDRYVLDSGTGEYGDGTAKLKKYDANGAPLNFSGSAKYISANTLNGTPKGVFAFPGTPQVVVDRSGGPTDGYIYLTDAGTKSGVHVFAPSGLYIDTIETGSSGVALSDSGDIYVSASSVIYHYDPVDGNPDNNILVGTLSGIGTSGPVAVDDTGAVYTTQPSIYWWEPMGYARRFAAAQFGSGNPKPRVYETRAQSVAIDPVSQTLIADAGNQLVEYSTAGKVILPSIGSDQLKDSRGVIVGADGRIYASDFQTGKVSVYGPVEDIPDAVESNPLVVHAVDTPGAHRYGDFQVAPEGGTAVFTSNLSLTKYPSARFSEVYRYDFGAEQMDCVSCDRTEADPTAHSYLSAQGLSLSDDGRVFFSTGQQLVLRDAGARKDVYEWKDGDIQLISTGISSFDATLLGVSADGTDVHFFSRDELIGKGESGQAMKIYDARENGGKFVIPPPPACAASDECHGPSTKAAGPQGISTLEGAGGQHKAKVACKKGKVRKHGKCVKKPGSKKAPKQKKQKKHSGKGGK